MDLWVLLKGRILIAPLYRLLFSCAVSLDSGDSFVSLSLLSVVISLKQQGSNTTFWSTLQLSFYQIGHSFLDKYFLNLYK